MNRVLKIAIIGPQGSGKTTACLELATTLKKLGIHIKLISESAEDCPFPINEFSTVDANHWIIFNQLKLEMDAKAKFKRGVIICDRTPFDSDIYAFYRGHFLGNGLSKFVTWWLSTYDLIFFADSSGGHLDNNGVRSTDKQFQIDIEKLFNEIIISKNIKVIRSKKPVQEVMDYIKKLKEKDINEGLL